MDGSPLARTIQRIETMPAGTGTGQTVYSLPSATLINNLIAAIQAGWTIFRNGTHTDYRGIRHGNVVGSTIKNDCRGQVETVPTILWDRQPFTTGVEAYHAVLLDFAALGAGFNWSHTDSALINDLNFYFNPGRLWGSFHVFVPDTNTMTCDWYWNIAGGNHLEPLVGANLVLLASDTGNIVGGGGGTNLLSDIRDNWSGIVDNRDVWATTRFLLLTWGITNIVGPPGEDPEVHIDLQFCTHP